MKFTCLMCARCCRDLIHENPLGVNGLLLLPEEVKLFQNAGAEVYPFIGVGEDDEPEKILAYQLSSKVCPHLLEDNRCAIYPDRPLLCRSFPVEYVRGGWAFLAENCTFINRNLGDRMVDVSYFSRVEVEANMELQRRIRRGMRSFKTKIWIFDLKAEKWKELASFSPISLLES